MLPNSLNQLISHLSRLPGVGEKSATRLALSIIKQSPNDVQDFAESLRTIHEKLEYCSICNNFSDGKECSICSNSHRNHSEIMVVETPLDILGFQSTDYSGVFHVTSGVISPLRGIGPDDLNIQKLLARVSNYIKHKQSGEGSDIEQRSHNGYPGGYKNLQIIMALPNTLEGDSTVSYINQLLTSKLNSGDYQVERLAVGLPSNSSLEYLDSSTLQASYQNRKPL